MSVPAHLSRCRMCPATRWWWLGLVTTKTPRRETTAELKQRIEEASALVPLERLALSPQCGFATSVIGNRITVEDQKRKLRVICETAREVWGR
mgnify:CR=1 FL=1